MRYFFSADTHYFHSNIINYCDRPFKDVEEMNSVIMKKFNEKVKKDDTVYFLGDFGFFASSNRAFRGEGQPYNADDILKQLNGKRWYFVKGNHDKSSNKLKTNVKSITIKQSNLTVELVHNPKDADIKHDLILCGHVHEKYLIKEIKIDKKIVPVINVCVDMWNFYPVTWEDIYNVYCKWK